MPYLTSQNFQGSPTNGELAAALLRARPKLFTQVFDQYMEENLLKELDTIDLASNEIIEGNEGEFAVLNWISEKGGVGAVASSGSLLDSTTGITVAFPTNGALITMNAASHNTAGTKSVGVLGNTVMINNTYARVIAKNTVTNGSHKLLLQPMTQTAYAPATDPYANLFSGFANRPAYSTPNLATTIQVGAAIVFPSSSYAPNYNSQIDGNSRIPSVFNTFSQIVRTPYSIDATTSSSLLEYGTTAPGAPKYQVYQGEMDTMNLHRLQLAGGAYFSQPGTTLDEAGNTVMHMDSIQSNIRAFGLRYQQTPGSHNLSDLMNIDVYQNNNRGAKKQLIRAGLNWVQDNDIIFSNFTEKGGIVYDRQLIDLKYRGIGLTTRNYYVKVDEMFSHPNYGNSAGNDYMNKAFVIPFDKVTDPKTNEAGMAFSLAFLKDPKFGIRKYVPVNIGYGAGNSRKDGYTHELLSEVMCKFLGAGQAAEMY